MSIQAHDIQGIFHNYNILERHNYETISVLVFLIL